MSNNLRSVLINNYIASIDNNIILKSINSFIRDNNNVLNKIVMTDVKKIDKLLNNKNNKIIALIVNNNEKISYRINNIKELLIFITKYKTLHVFNTKIFSNYNILLKDEKYKTLIKDLLIRYNLYTSNKAINIDRYYYIVLKQFYKYIIENNTSKLYNYCNDSQVYFIKRKLN